MEGQPELYSENLFQTMGELGGMYMAVAYLAEFLTREQGSIPSPIGNKVWCHTPVIPSFTQVEQEAPHALGYTASKSRTVWATGDSYKKKKKSQDKK